MKKKFTFMMAVLILLIFMMPTMAGWGQTRDTKTDIMFAKGFGGYTNNSYSAAGTDRTAVANSTNATGVTYAMQVFNGSQGTVRGNQSGAANYSCRNTTTYNDYYISSVTLTITGGTLKKSNGRSLVYFGSSAYDNPNTITLTGTSTTASLSSDSKTLTWTNTDESVSHFILYNLETSGNCYSANADSPLTVVWTSKTPASSVATPQLSKGTSYCDEEQSITITCDTEGATIHYTLDGTDPTSESTIYSEAISITTTTTLKAIAIKGSGSSAVASATYTIVNTIKTMEAIYAAATAAGSTPTTVYIHFNNWVISGIQSGSSNYAFLTDGTYGCQIYGSGHGFVAGKKLNGIASCDLKLQYEMACITGLTASSSGLEISDGGTVTPVVTTIDALSGIRAGSVVTLKGLTWDGDNSVLSDGTYTIKNSNQISTQTLTNDYTYDITGVLDYDYYVEKRINPRNAADVVLGPATLPFEWTGGGKNALMALQGVTANGLGTDYSSSTHGNYIVRMDDTGDYIMVRTDSQPGVVTIGVKMIGGGTTSKITVQASTDGVTFDEGEDLTISGISNAIVELTSTRTFGADVRYVKLYYTKGSNIGVGPISIAKPTSTPSISVDAEKDIDYNVTASSITYTINNPVDGGKLTAAITAGNTGEWLELGTVTSSAVPFTCSANTTNSPRSATVTLTYTYGDSQTTTATVEVSQSGTPRYYALAKSIIPGKSYIITNGSDKAMGQQNSNNRAAVGVSIINGIATVTNNDVYEFVVNTTLINDKVYYSFYDETNNGYLYPATGGNYLRIETTLSNSSKWDISFKDGGVATIVSQTTLTTDEMRYNNSNNLFSCYASGQNDIYLYMKVDNYLTDNGNWSDGTKWIKGTVPTSSNDVAINAACTIPSDGIAQASNIIIAGSSSSLTIEDGGQLIIHTGSTVAATFKKNMPAAKNGKDDITVNGWELISSPTNNGTDAGGSYENFASVTHLTDASYVLFKYDEKNRQWINSNHEGDEFTKLYVGQGYLYGNTTGTTVEFTGNVNSAESYTCSLAYNVKEGDNLAGFNLIGNPYSHELVWGTNVIRTGSVSNGYYKIVDDAFETKLYNDPIAPMQGILVQAQAVSQSVTFYNEEISGDKGEKANADNIMFKVENSEYSDVAYALFDKGYGLNKISHRGENVPMLYIPQDGTNYAIAMMDDNTNSFNLNFEAKTMGQYKLSYKVNGEFNYLHVIDRTTGEDIDMLLEGSYSFIGSPMDNAQRFIVRLGYLPNYEDNGEDIFAYQSGNDIIVSGEGELQIFDVMGRKVSTMNIYGVETISGIAQGVYIFRMEGKTQKIVVR